MQHILLDFLYQTGSLPLPGIGTVMIRREPAQSDFANKQLLPPSYIFSLDAALQQHLLNRLFNYIAVQQTSTQDKAIQLLNEWCYQIKNAIKKEGFHWEGLGWFRENDKGVWIIETEKEPFRLWQPQKAERVIHPKQEHRITVGDLEKTNTEMQNWLHQGSLANTKSWILPAIISSFIITSFFVLRSLSVLLPVTIHTQPTPIIHFYIK